MTTYSMRTEKLSVKKLVVSDEGIILKHGGWYIFKLIGHNQTSYLYRCSYIGLEFLLRDDFHRVRVRRVR